MSKLFTVLWFMCIALTVFAVLVTGVFEIVKSTPDMVLITVGIPATVIVSLMIIKWVSK